MPSPVVHITYATAQFSQAVALLKKSAAHFGLETNVFGPDSPSIRDLAARHPDIMQQPRGAGYWLWKPQIILDTLNAVPDGTIVLYTDVAMTFVRDPAPMLALAEHHPIVLFDQSAQTIQATETKRDCFIALDADSAEFWNSPHLVGGVQVYKAGPEARAFASDVVRVSADTRTLTDAPNIMGKANRPGFRHHRHDQSILSIMAQKARLPLFPDPSQYGPQDANNWPPRDDGVVRPAVSYRGVFWHHRLRDTGTLRFLKRRLLGRYTGNGWI